MDIQYATTNCLVYLTWRKIYIFQSKLIFSLHDQLWTFLFTKLHHALPRQKITILHPPVEKRYGGSILQYKPYQEDALKTHSSFKEAEFSSSPRLKNLNGRSRKRMS